MIVARLCIFAVLLACSGSLIEAVATSAVAEKPLCDLHTTDRGPRTPSTTLPQPAEQGWLSPSPEEVRRHYVAAKRECERFASSPDSLARHFQAKIAPVYPQPIRNAQTLCRGRDTLFQLTGKILWPFGPGIAAVQNKNNNNNRNGNVSLSAECTTYSQCWFGVLSCGEFKQEQTFKTTKSEIDKVRLRVTEGNVSFPEGPMRWSMRALSLQLRVVGPEIVVPAQRVVSLSSLSENKGPAEDGDVIIAQYALSIPAQDYVIEMRHFELYPSALLSWKEADREIFQTHDFGVVFLGGSEARCRPWTRCVTDNHCCGCDERSFVLHSPLPLVVKDGETRCREEFKTNKPAALPICRLQSNADMPSGRWIQGNFVSPQRPKVCTPQSSYNMLKMSQSQFPRDVDKLAAEDQLNAEAFRGWYEASGNPCMSSAPESAEERGSPNWFFAPYTCKYHFFERHEAHQCLKDLGIGHIHFQGDSMSRELFLMLSAFLGVPQISEAELKKMTNVLKLKDIRFHSGAVLLSEGYSWDFNLGVLQLSEQYPLPNVILTNYAISHRSGDSYTSKLYFDQNEMRYWTTDRNQSLPKPKFLIFQNTRELHGKRNPAFEGNRLRHLSSYLKQRYGELGFWELDEFQITTGRYDLNIKHGDGWHFMGTARQMEVIIFLNKICNEWLVAAAANKSSIS